ncbi:MAG: carotenoid oxygenase family protein [Aquabacterium sp.]|nr:carotenoid oxygenase family protein [Aquabacterium sp.]
MSQNSTTSPFLEGIFAPVYHETTQTQLEVIGELPVELNGLYARTGPNPTSPPKPGKYHWFIGDGMVHGLRLKAGKPLWYHSRWIGTNSVNKALGRPILPGKRRGVSDVVNTMVFGHAGRVWASTEAGVLPVELDGELNSIKHSLFDSKSPTAYTAHPHLDPLTGDLHSICYDALTPWRVRYVRVSAAGQVDRVVNIPVKHGPMIHDCAITASKVIVLDLPVTFSLLRAVGGSSFPYGWNPKHQARVGLLPRNGDAKDIRWFDVDPCFVFHPCNAYDLPDGTVVMDVVVHQRMFDRSKSGPELDGKSCFERWTLPAGGWRVQRQLISDLPQEFPRLDERLVGQPYRYAYAVGTQQAPQAGQPLLRHDMHTGATVQHVLGQHLTPSEFVFVPRHARGGETDGWLVGFAHNHESDRGEFHVINADDFGGAPQAIVKLSERVPAGFHGNWMADAN